MIISTAYKGKTIGVFGLARTGVAVVDALHKSGATVLAWDDSAARVAAVGPLAHNLYDADFSLLDYLLLAPGVPLTHPVPHPLAVKAQEAGVPVIGDFDLFAWAQADLPAHKTVAITGTNGKSTTTALITHMINACGGQAVMAGNIGTGLMSLSPLQEGGVYVFEMSSYQIDLTHDFRPDVSVLVNISPDHLDRHGDMAGYVAAKQRLFEMQGESGGTAIISLDDAASETIANKLRQEVVPISVQSRLIAGVYVQDGLLFEAKDGKPTLVCDVSGISTLKGRHNWQNAAMAYAVLRALGYTVSDIAAGFASFPGLAHRQEVVAVIDDVSYVNDSKATNVEAAATGLAAYQHIHWIAGGRSKEDNIQALMPYLSHVKAAYLIGEATEMFARELGGEIPLICCEDLHAAIDAANQNAVEGEVVLLSPACAAFDQFDNFEHRGDSFRAYVQQLKGQAA